MTTLSKQTPPYLTQRVFRALLALFLIATCLASYSYYDPDKFAALALSRYGADAQKVAIELNGLIDANKSSTELEKLQKINHFFNVKVDFASDLHVWKQVDYWASPLESLGRHTGDCEDFSIAKYIFLKVLNVPNEKLKLTYVKATIQSGTTKTTEAHMVLSYYATPQAEPLILDNINREILPASKRQDLSPVFSFNDKGLWVGGNVNQSGDSQKNLSKWRDVLTRMQSEGLDL